MRINAINTVHLMQGYLNFAVVSDMAIHTLSIPKYLSVFTIIHLQH
jgi:hypothetical protein